MVRKVPSAPADLHEPKVLTAQVTLFREMMSSTTSLTTTSALDPEKGLLQITFYYFFYKIVSFYKKVCMCTHNIKIHFFSKIVAFIKILSTHNFCRFFPSIIS